MPMPSSSVKFAKDSLYRRLQNQWWDKHGPNPESIPTSFFVPKKHDSDGLSVSRASITPIEVTRKTRSGKDFCTAIFPEESVISRGLTIHPSPTDDDDGHAVISELNYPALQDPQKSDAIMEHADAIAKHARIAWAPEPS